MKKKKKKKNVFFSYHLLICIHDSKRVREGEREGKNERVSKDVTNFSIDNNNNKAHQNHDEMNKNLIE
jgi:hypothetical protein